MLMSLKTGDVSGYKTVSASNPYWYGLMAESVNFQAGTAIYNQLKSPFTVAAFTHPVASGHKSQASISLSPVMPKYNIDGDYSETSLSYVGEIALREITMVPGTPVLLASTMAAQQSYGPVFVSSIDFEVSGQGSLSPVRIRASFDGGKSVQCPIMSQFLPYAGDLDAYGYSNEMRTASMIDCGFDCNAHYSIDELNLAMALTRYWPSERIVGLRLSVQQQLEFTFPCHERGRKDAHGPRFVSVFDRKVSGSVIFAGRNSPSDFNGMQYGDTGAVTMYFGGAFLFTMENVEWSLPEFSMSAGGIPIQEYRFIARAAQSAVQKPYQLETPGFPTSEFSIYDPETLQVNDVGDSEDEDNNEQ